MGVLHRGFCLLGIALTALASASAFAQITSLEDLAFYSEVYPPANFIKDELPAGYSVDILIEAAKLQGVQITPQQIVIQPWARSYRATLTNSDAVLFSTTRTEHRESLFKWVGPISDIKAVVLARVDSGIAIKDPIDMANYRIGVIRDDVGEQMLLALGVPREAMQEANYVTQLAEQLMKKRIDLLAYDESAALWWASQAGLDPKMFKVVYILKKGELYFAFNKHVPQKVVEQLQMGIDRLKSEKNAEGISLHQAIMNRYR